MAREKRHYSVGLPMIPQGRAPVSLPRATIVSARRPILPGIKGNRPRCCQTPPLEPIPTAIAQ